MLAYILIVTQNLDENIPSPQQNVLKLGFPL